MTPEALPPGRKAAKSGGLISRAGFKCTYSYHYSMIGPKQKLKLIGGMNAGGRATRLLRPPANEYLSRRF